jgi:hypothetical protein
MVKRTWNSFSTCMPPDKRGDRLPRARTRPRLRRGQAAHSCCHQKSDGNMLPPPTVKTAAEGRLAKSSRWWIASTHRSECKREGKRGSVGGRLCKTRFIILTLPTKSIPMKTTSRKSTPRAMSAGGLPVRCFRERGPALEEYITADLWK